MTDYERQKTLAGMAACTDYRDCKECPYDAKYDRQVDCMYALIQDMAEMIDELKQQQEAQEPRVIPAEELVSHKSGVWIEHVSGMAPMRAMLYCITGNMGIFLSPEEKVTWHEGSWWSELISWSMLIYGKTWRCWTSRPTDEQRKAVKWDD